MRVSARLLSLVALAAAPVAAPAVAQSAAITPRFGAAFNALAVIPDGFGLGVRGRAAVPVNSDLSLALDVGVNAMGVLFGGRNSADWVVDPALSVVINLPNGQVAGRRFSYLLAGVGGYFPTGTDANGNSLKGGPTIHGGIGWVTPLNETSVFYEVDPALIIASDKTHIMLPVRIGLIF